MTTSVEQHQVEPDGYCTTCGTVGCLQRPGQRRSGPSGLLGEVRALRDDVAAIADHLGVAARNCPACGARHRGDACPSCGTRADLPTWSSPVESPAEDSP